MNATRGGVHGCDPSWVRARSKPGAGPAWAPCGRGLDQERERLRLGVERPRPGSGAARTRCKHDLVRGWSDVDSQQAWPGPMRAMACRAGTLVRCVDRVPQGGH